VKVSSHEDDFYGKIYIQRKALEIARNDNGDFAEQAAVRAKQVKNTTDAYKYYKTGVLSPGHIHSRAKRYAVKIFLSHYHEVGRKMLGLPVRPPYPLEHLASEHGHKIEPPPV